MDFFIGAVFLSVWSLLMAYSGFYLYKLNEILQKGKDER